VALLQALGAGIVFLVAGVPHAGLLALVVLVLAMSQIGANFVLVPVTIWAWLTWPVPGAVAFTLAVIVIMAMDYVLKPLVMRKGYDAPIIAVFLGLLAGVAAFGLPGLFLGPVIVVLVHELLREELGSSARP
jgi:predicted PurR-regulated permease PerM